MFQIAQTQSHHYHTMLSDKLISLLANLSKVERNRFRKFLLSPYLNDQPDAIILFDLIDKELRNSDTTEVTLSKQFVWSTLYPKIVFNDGHLRRLSSDLSQLTLKFMVLESQNADPLQQALDLQKALEKPQLKKHLAGVERQLVRLLDSTEEQSSEFFMAQYRMYHNVFYRASKTVTTTGYGDKLEAADFHLECFYLIQKLKYYVAWLQFSGIRVAEKTVPLFPGFWEYLNQERFKTVPLIAIYRLIAKCFSEPQEEQHFRDLLEYLNKYSSKLTEENLRECYHMAQNYCALKINQGKTEYYSIYFELQKKVVQQGILLENGQLSEGVFKNTITSGLRVGEFTWTEKFIEDYYPFLPTSIRENARTFNLANLYSHQKQHDKVIELLNNVEYSDLVYALGAKLILLRTYYEKNEIMALDSLMDSFRIFIRRNKQMSKGLKREYINFLNFLSKLSSISHRHSQKLVLLKKASWKTSK